MIFHFGSCFVFCLAYELYAIICFLLQRKGTSMEDTTNRKFRRKDSTNSAASSSCTRETKNKKNLSKNLTVARRMKMEAINGEVDLGHVVEVGDDTSLPTPGPTEGSLSRGSTTGSDHSGSLRYGKSNLSKKSGGGSATGNSTAASSSGVLLGKSSSLIFPTGVEASTEEHEEMTNEKRSKINFLLDQCETVRFPFKKKLMLENLNLTAHDVPVRDLCNTSLGNTLHKLSLSGNHLSVVPDLLVCCLPMLKTLDLSQCDLHQLPEKWNLPQLKRLNLSHNRLVEFPDEVRLWTEHCVCLILFPPLILIPSVWAAIIHAGHAGGIARVSRPQYVRQ